MELQFLDKVGVFNLVMIGIEVFFFGMIVAATAQLESDCQRFVIWIGLILGMILTTVCAVMSMQIAVLLCAVVYMMMVACAMLQCDK